MVARYYFIDVYEPRDCYLILSGATQDRGVVRLQKKRGLIYRNGVISDIIGYRRHTESMRYAKQTRG
jgi:hypothetical protein